MNSSNQTKLSLALTLAVCLSAPLGAYAGENEPAANDYSAIYKGDSNDASGANLTVDRALIDIPANRNNIYGGYSVDGNATDNTVTMVSPAWGKIRRLYGGYSVNGDVTGNNTIIEAGASLECFAIYGGYSENGNATNNSIELNGTNSTNDISAGYSEYGQANNNTLTIKGTQNYIDGLATAGATDDSTGGDANNNTLLIEGGTIGNAIAGKAINGNVSRNHAKIIGNATVQRVFAGASSNKLAEYNIAELNGGTVGEMYGAAANEANYNKAIVTAGTVTNHTVGGMAQFGKADYNSVEITGGSVGEVYGGISATSANYNTVLIGGTADIRGNTIAGAKYDAGGSATHNTVTIEGTPTIDPRTLVYGGAEWSGNSGTRTGNTLNIYTSNIAVATVDYFQHYDLALDKNNITLSVGNPITLQAGDTIKATRVLSDLSVGDSFTVLDNNGGLNLNGATLIDGEAKKGALYVYNYQLRQDTNGNLVADIVARDTNKQTMSVADGQLAALGMLRSGADMISGSAMSTAAQNANHYDVFAAMNYGNYHMNSVSNIDVQGTSMLVGMSRNLQHTNSHTIIGAFLESGWGTYDSELGEARAKGHTNYYGLGVLARHNQDSGIYTEGSLRVGKVGNTYSGYRADDGSYDASSTYYGLHLGIGKIHKLNDTTNIDYYGKYFYVHESGTDANLLGDKFDFDSIDSHRIRVGARLNNTNKNITRYIGLAYEYEFRGTAKASAYGMDIASPSAKGSSGLLELGVTYKPSIDSRFSMDMGLTGYAGKRQGVSGNVNLNWAF